MTYLKTVFEPSDPFFLENGMLKASINFIVQNIQRNLRSQSVMTLRYSHFDEIKVASFNQMLSVLWLPPNSISKLIILDNSDAQTSISISIAKWIEPMVFRQRNYIFYLTDWNVIFFFFHLNGLDIPHFCDCCNNLFREFKPLVFRWWQFMNSFI